jgi:hypothetical protein
MAAKKRKSPPKPKKARKPRKPGGGTKSNAWRRYAGGGGVSGEPIPW